MWYAILLTALTSYLLGNLNGAVNISFLLDHDDVRKHGSGNAGLTNFIRNFGAKTAALVLLIDAGKAVLSCLLGGLLLKPYGLEAEGMILGMVCVSLGHDFPALLGFKGGKGIVCGFTAVTVFDWRIGLIAGCAFFLIYFATRYVSLGSVIATTVVCICFILFYRQQLWVFIGGVFAVLLALWMHRENIVRLCKGTERKSNLFGKGRKK